MVGKFECAAVRAAGAVTMVVLLAGCGGEGPTAPTAAPPSATSQFQQHVSEHFTFHYTPMDAASIATTATLVEARYSRIVADLGSPAMSRVTVTLHPSTASLQPILQSAGASTTAAVGLVTNASTVHLLSPHLTATWSYDTAITAIVHEFAHCVSMHVHPSIPNNPRWLWETVAVYEANDFVHPRNLPAMVNGEPPSLARLNGFDNVDVYLVGYTIGEFIVERWRRAGLVALIRNNGNLLAVTGLAETQFFAEWYSFVRARYLSTSTRLQRCHFAPCSHGVGLAHFSGVTRDADAQASKKCARCGGEAIYRPEMIVPGDPIAPSRSRRASAHPQPAWQCVACSYIEPVERRTARSAQRQDT